MTSAAVPSSVERTLKYVRTAGYVILLFAVLFPLLDLGSSLVPTHFDSATWRFGATGLVSNYMMGASIELLLMVLLALFSNQRRVLLVLAAITAIVTVALLGGSLLFVLDAIQTRSKVAPAALHRFELASVIALLKMLVFAFANGALARGALRGAREERFGSRAKGAPAPLIVSQQVQPR
jgi:hypothetical protein